MLANSFKSHPVRRYPSTTYGRCTKVYETHGKNYIRPAETQIKQILKKLDEETPDWDDKNPEMFYADLKPIEPR